MGVTNRNKQCFWIPKTENQSLGHLLYFVASYENICTKIYWYKQYDFKKIITQITIPGIYTA